MNNTLKQLVKVHGLSAVLAGLRQLTIDEARDLRELDGPADLPTIVALEAAATVLFEAAVECNELMTPTVEVVER